MSDIIVQKAIDYGILGLVLVWFMVRYEGIIKANTDAIIALSKLVDKLCEGEKKV